MDCAKMMDILQTTGDAPFSKAEAEAFLAHANPRNEPYITLGAVEGLGCWLLDKERSPPTSATRVPEMPALSPLPNQGQHLAEIDQSLSPQFHESESGRQMPHVQPAPSIAQAQPLPEPYRQPITAQQRYVAQGTVTDMYRAPYSTSVHAPLEPRRRPDLVPAQREAGVTVDQVIVERDKRTAQQPGRLSSLLA